METVTRVVGIDGRCAGEKVQLATQVDPALAAKIKAYATEDGRSVSNALARLLEKALSDHAATGTGWDHSEVRAG